VPLLFFFFINLQHLETGSTYELRTVRPRRELGAPYRHPDAGRALHVVIYFIHLMDIARRAGDALLVDDDMANLRGCPCGVVHVATKRGVGPFEVCPTRLLLLYYSQA